MNKFIYILLLSLSFTTLLAQDSTSVNKKRVKTIVYGGTLTYGVTLIGLNELWYKNSPQTNFHFFNDNHEWLQVDKVGHCFTAYQISRGGAKSFEWAGYSPKKAALLGAITGLIFQTPIEILDGFSSEYGASWGDVIGNTIGSSMLYAQYAAWDELRLILKFSYYKSNYAALRPNVLGSNFAEEVMKDYNAQTYWLSGNLHSFYPNSDLPTWLNVAIGYGANDMVSAFIPNNRALGFSPYRQLYLSLDVDLTKIKTRSKTLQTLFFVFNTLKIPFPAIEFSERGTTFHPIKF